jgi:hypothetical protein
VIGGGAAFAPAPGAPSPDQLAAAARAACGPHATHRPPPVASTRPVDPALLALGVLLGDAAPPDRPPTAAQVIAGRLAALLAASSARISALGALLADAVRAGSGAGGDAAADARGASDVPVAQPVPPRPPMQPPGPLLTIDPVLGTIVATDPEGGIPLGATPGSGAGSTDDPRAPLLPSAWVPVTLGVAAGLGRSARAGAHRLLDRIDEWLDDLGISRLQLLALTFLAPAAVTFLAAVAWSVLEGR